MLQTLERLNKEEGVTMMMVTHDAQAASYCDRVIFIKDGTLYQELHKTGSRQIFFQGIMDILSSIGGTRDEYSPVRA